MIVSHNEIITLIRKAFEALGYSQGQWEEIADMVAWRELHGLPGVEPAAVAVRRGYSLRTAQIELVEATSEEAVFDGHGQSALLIGPQVVDWAYTAAVHRGRARVKVIGCKDPGQLMGYAVASGGRAFRIRLSWDLMTGRTATFFVQQGELHFGHSGIGESEPEPRHLIIEIDRQQKLDLPVGFTVVLTAADFLQRRESRSQHGIPLNKELWEFFKKIGQGVLVEATEQSRKGAGE